MTRALPKAAPARSRLPFGAAAGTNRVQSALRRDIMTAVQADDQLLQVTSTADGWAIGGEIDASTVHRLIAAFEQLPDGAGVVTVDVGEVSFIDSSGLRALLLLAERVRADDRELKLTRPSTAVARLVDITGLTALFGIEPTDSGD